MAGSTFFSSNIIRIKYKYYVEKKKNGKIINKNWEKNFSRHSQEVWINNKKLLYYWPEDIRKTPFFLSMSVPVISLNIMLTENKVK